VCRINKKNALVVKATREKTAISAEVATALLIFVEEYLKG
jgi:hypothetical protein